MDADRLAADGSVDAVGVTAVLGVDRTALARLVATLTARRLTVATAESLTGGLLAGVLTEIPGASAVVRGSLVCYATDLKATLAGVDAALLASVGPVHPEVARQLAAGARQRCAADIGVGLTGVAGPDPQGGHQPGTVFVGIAAGGPPRAVRLDLPPTGREGVRAAAVRTALGLLAGEAGVEWPREP